MTDVVDKAKRSQMMAGIQGKDTQPEILIRRALHKSGIRYRLHVPDLPGKPDIVCRKYKAVILVHGCFWHRHHGCWWCTTPGSNKAFWLTKFEKNVWRDKRNIADLRQMGWRVGIVWECAIRLRSADDIAELLKEWLASRAEELVLPSDSERRLARRSKSKKNLKPNL